VPFKTLLPSELCGLHVALSAPTVSHLLFADGSLLLFKVSTESANKVQDLLDCYCMALSQSINWDKSYIFFSKGFLSSVQEGMKTILDV
jgi:hypothetical protein